MDIVYCFAGKTFIPSRNLLADESGEHILEQRVSDLLLVFCQRPDEALSKAELMANVWPDRVVNEDSLSVAISKLRKVLKDSRQNPKFIKTLSGRGYLWLAQVDTSTADADPAPVVPIKQKQPGNKSVWFALSLLPLVIIVAVIGYRTQVPAAAIATTLPPENVQQQHEELSSRLAQIDAESQREVIKDARQITEDYPDYLPAYITIAQAKLNLSMLNSYRDIHIYQPEIESIINFVLARDPENGRAWLYRGWLAQIADWEYESAGSAYLNAMAYSPDDPLVYLAYSEYLLALGDFTQAETFFAQLRRENPDYYKYLNMSFVYMLKGEYGKARAEVHRISNSEAESRISQRVLNRIAILEGKEDEAFATLKRLMYSAGLDDDFISDLETQFLRQNLAAVYKTLLEQRIDVNLGHHLPPLAWARYAIIAGDFGQALKWLQEAVDTKQPAAIFIPMDPLYQPLQSLPEFQLVTQRIEAQISR